VHADDPGNARSTWGGKWHFLLEGSIHSAKFASSNQACPEAEKDVSKTSSDFTSAMLAENPDRLAIVCFPRDLERRLPGVLLPRFV
jgi:hypothetical protein